MTQLFQDDLPDFVLVRTDDVDPGDRLRPLDPVWAAALGQIMLREGQRTPVEICRLPGRDKWTLVSGGHRLAGAEHAGIEHLRAEIVTADRDNRRMREVSENLWRRDLSPIDRAAFVAEAVAIHKRRAGIDPASDGRVASAAARWQKAVKDEAGDATVTMTVAYGFTEMTAAELGFSASKVERDLLLYRRLAPSLIDSLRNARHPILRNAAQLRSLAKLDEAAQHRAVNALVAGAKTIAEAARPAGANRPVDPEAKRLSAFIGAFSRMGKAERKAALFQLAGMLPAGTTLNNGEQRPAKPAFPAAHVQFRDEALKAIDAVRDLVDGLLEDEVIPDERADELRRASGQLQLTRFAIAGNGFELGAAA